MSFRSVLVAIASLSVGVALLTVLVIASGLRLPAMLSSLATMDRLACFRLTGLVAVNTLLSSWKWRLTDRAMRHSSEGSPSHFESFALSSIGTALGQILPVQLSMPIARTIGTRIHGRAFQRGTLGTFFEQSFDVFFGCFLVIPSVATYLLRGGWRTWLAITVPSAIVVVVSAGLMLGLVRRLASKVLPNLVNPSRWGKIALEFSNSALLDAGLGRKLMFLSAVRFTILILMAGETTAAIHVNVPLWHLAEAMPFALLATATGITPGGLGLTEFTYVGILNRLGTPLAVTTQWALSNRLLVSGGSILVTILLLPFYFIVRGGTRPTVSAESIANARLKDAR